MVLLCSHIATAPLFAGHGNQGVEICDNAVDDDGDGLIDLNDPECICQIIRPESLIPNPSFEDMNCCPFDRSELNCADTWIQASAPTTDYLHLCGWMGWEDFPPPLPFPDGEGIVGFRDGRAIHINPEPHWKEYAGACLSKPLLAQNTYRFEFYVGFVDDLKSPPIDMTLFGTADCSNLPFGGGDINFGCPTNGPGWTELGASNVGGKNWVKTSIEFTPEEDIHAIVIGASCAAIQTETSLYYFLDNLILADQRSFEFNIKGDNNKCKQDFSLSVPDYPSFEYQWYADGIALPGQTTSILKETMPGKQYQVRIISDTECKLSEPYTYHLPVQSVHFEATICDGETYQFGAADLATAGSYVDTFQNKMGCDSIVYLDLRSLDNKTDSINALIFEGEIFRVGGNRYRMPGQYEAVIPTVAGCDSIIWLNLDYYHLFIPNSFSPNGDGVNDLFTIFGGSEVVEISKLNIFNRWGALVFDMQHFPPNHYGGWNGLYNGQAAAQGVYLYQASVQMNDGVNRTFYGSVTLIR